jgi:hypothetical protein
MGLLRPRSRAVRAAFIAALLVPAVAASGASASTLTIPGGGIKVIAADGAGTSTTPGRSCAEGGTGAYWHYDYGADLLGGSFSNLATTSRVHLDLRSDRTRYTNASGAYTSGPNPAAYLQGVESHASLLNQRGAVKVRLSSGTCANPTLAFDGSNASGTGQWSVDRGSGAYRDITGSGTFTLTNAEVNPGADNALNLQLNGSFTIPDPALSVQVLKTYWGGLGTDYLSRRVTVVYRITNSGQGDAFGAKLTSTSSSTGGVTPLGPTPQALFDIPAGSYQDVQVRYQFSLLLGPCKLVLLDCPFSSTVNVDFPDAFDVAHPLSASVSAKAPNLPPPL